MTIALRSAEIASAEATSLNARVAAGRECGTCTLCCKVAAVEEVDKRNGVWCLHCVSGKRCTIYQQRPPSCRSFYCQWMVEKGLGLEWKPERAKFALVKTTIGAASNVILNLLLIPRYAGIGAAVATTVSYALASFLLNVFNARSRKLFYLQLWSLLPIFQTRN